jgi:hypothetical protein
MKIAFCILIGILTIPGLLIIGETISKNLSKEHPFRKWWENNIIGEDNTQF